MTEQEPKEIVVYQPASGGALMPAMTVQDAVGRYKMMVAVVNQVMVKDLDYGIVPGTGNKPSLLKPGAEKLASFFGLSANPILKDKIEDWDKGLFYYRYEMELWRNSVKYGGAEGSCNSRESKYRWRSVPEWKATEEQKKAGRKEIKTGKDGKYSVYVVENENPADLINTLQKMAQKRALIGAVLVTTNASQFFTQDIEDLVDGEVVEVTTAQKPAAPPEQATEQPEASKTNSDKPEQAAQKTGPWWAKDKKELAAFWGKLGALGIDEVAAHSKLKVNHLSDLPMTMTAEQAIKIITG